MLHAAEAEEGFQSISDCYYRNNATRMHGRADNTDKYVRAK